VAHVFVAADSFGLSLQPLMSPWLGDVTWLSVNGAFAEGDLQAGVRDAGTIIVVLTERDLIDLLPAITQGATRALAP
jgi:hypothetical protein